MTVGEVIYAEKVSKYIKVFKVSTFDCTEYK